MIHMHMINKISYFQNPDFQEKIRFIRSKTSNN